MKYNKLCRNFSEQKLMSLNQLVKGTDDKMKLGPPYCVTIDFDSLEDSSVTIRNRDSMVQERIKIEDLLDYFLKI